MQLLMASVRSPQELIKSGSKAGPPHPLLQPLRWYTRYIAERGTTEGERLVDRGEGGRGEMVRMPYIKIDV